MFLCFTLGCTEVEKLVAIHAEDGRVKVIAEELEELRKILRQCALVVDAELL